MLETRKMRARDMVRFSRYVLPKFFGEMVMNDGREIGAVAIVWKDTRAFLCLEITDELRRFPVFLVKIGHRFINAAIAAGCELFTLEDKEEVTSKRFLEFLGFADTGEVIDGERVLQWRKS